MQKCLYVFWPCWGSNKGNIQIIIIRDVVPWLICEGFNKLSDDICKCMEWTTISITLTFQYNFCLGIVLGDPGAVSHQKYVLCMWTYISLGSYHEKPWVQCTYYLHGKTGNSGWKINLVRIISFRRLQKIWAVIWDDAINLFFYPFQSVQLIWINTL